MRLIDTHQHLWDLTRFPYSWCAGIPKLNRSFSLDDYREASAEAGIDRTIFMECDVDEPHQLAEAEWIQQVAEQTPLIAGIVASGRPEAAGFATHLEQLTRLSRVRGVRRVLHTQPDQVSQTPQFAENVRRLAPLGWTFDLCVLARQLPVATALVDRCPEVTFILDHCGVPEVKARALDPWRQEITRLAERPNVNCKISGLVAYADPASWSVADLRPWVEHVIACFGWSRVVWGGDWPVCTLTASLGEWVEATHELFRDASADERAALYHRNAERIYRV